MNCHEFWDHLPERGQEIIEAQSAHLAGCPACAAQWGAHGSLAAGLHAMAEDWQKAEAPARVEAGLMAAFRMQTARQAGRAIHRTWWTPVLAWTSAAAAMIALAVVLTHSAQPVPVKPGTVASPHRVSQPDVQVAATAGMDADFDDESAILGEGFVRLPNAAPIGPDEEWYLVRVEAPGSDLIADGVSVGEDRASETLVADVAYGSDGTKRAVRLVSDGGTF